jgi:hypothetical protein
LPRVSSTSCSRIRICTSCSACGSGRFFNLTAFSNWKIAVFAPIPRANDKAATVVNAGLFQSTRIA